MDYVANAADKQQIKKAAKKIRFNRTQELDDFRFILSTPSGRRVIWRYLSLVGVFQSSFTGHSETTIFNEGRRDVGLRLLADVMESDPKAYILMTAEANAEEETEIKKEETENV